MVEQIVNLRALLKRSAVPGRWVAICVDHYMVAEGDSPDEAMIALDRVAQSERSFGTSEEPLGHLPKAPRKYRVAYEEGLVVDKTWSVEDHLPDIEKAARAKAHRSGRKMADAIGPIPLFEQRVLAGV